MPYPFPCSNMIHVKEMHYPFPCSNMIHEWSRKKTHTEKKNIVDLCKVTSSINKLFIQYNRQLLWSHNRWCNMYLCIGKSIGLCVPCECFLVYVISNQITSKNHVIRVKPLVNLMPCSIIEKVKSS